jgi:hypothetical protein
MRTRQGREWTAFDWFLLALVGIWFALVALPDAGQSARSSFDRVLDGELWVLGTSSLQVAGYARGLQVLLLALLTALLIPREGPRDWWLVAIAGHVGSALIAYAVIALGIGLGFRSADAVSSQTDFGISCVMAALIGALAASGGLAMREGRAGRGDAVFLYAGLAGFVCLIPFSIGWYDVQHVIAWLLGAAVTWGLTQRRRGPVPSDARR